MLTEKEIAWIIECILSYKENCYFGNSEEAHECWNAERFDMDAQEFALITSIFDKLRPV